MEKEKRKTIQSYDVVVFLRPMNTKKKRNSFQIENRKMSMYEFY